MPAYLKLAGHLTTVELEQRYRGEKDAVARSHWQILWLMSSGKRTGEVAAATGYSVPWIRQIVHRYNEQGPSGVGGARHHNPGSGKLLSEEQEAELVRQLEAARAAGESWNGPRVVEWMSQKLGRTLYKARGWETLRRFGYSSQTPRPRHAKADAQLQATGPVQKNIGLVLREIRSVLSSCEVEYWTMDEHRIGHWVEAHHPAGVE